MAKYSLFWFQEKEMKILNHSTDVASHLQFSHNTQIYIISKSCYHHGIISSCYHCGIIMLSSRYHRVIIMLSSRYHHIIMLSSRCHHICITAYPWPILNCKIFAALGQLRRINHHCLYWPFFQIFGNYISIVLS